MSNRDVPSRWMIVIPGLLLLGCLLLVAVVSLRGAGPRRASSRRSSRDARSDGDRRRKVGDPWGPGPATRDDPRLSALRRAAASWRRAIKDERQVIDQVCLVPDVPAFLEAIAAWDDRYFFPILIEQPATVLPFLRAFGRRPWCGT